MGHGTDPDAEAPRQVIDRALELGVNFLDTADVYGPFTNEGVYNVGGLRRRFENYNSQKVLSLGSGTDRNGTVAVQETYRDGTGQIFYSQLPNPQGWAGQLRPFDGHDKCLEVKGARTADDAPVVNWSCNHRINHDWKAKG